jgi:hypothetical protein
MLLLAFACTQPEPAKDGDPAPEDTGSSEPRPIAPGETSDFVTNDDGSVSVEVLEAGTYVVVLFSKAVTQGTTFGYGENAGAGAVVTDPPDALPMPDDTPMVSSRAVAEGDTRQFTVYDGNTYVTVDATATSVTDAVVVWTDTTTPNDIGVLDEETIDGVLDSFETIVVPRERQIFGEISDVDGDGKLAVLLSYTVNLYGAQAYVTWCDIGAQNGCRGTTNGGEIIYMGIPDPESRYSSVDGITETFAHELNHLIYAWHKYVALDQADAAENVYLTEGMSALAQDLTGYNNGNQYVWASVFQSTFYDTTVDDVSLNDILRGESYYDAERDGALRGAGYLFLRYLFEQAGGMVVHEDGTLEDAGGMAWAQDWFGSAELGPDAVVSTTGRDTLDVALDWYTALVATGLVEVTDPRFTYQDRVADPITTYEYGVDPYANVHGWLELSGPPIQPVDEADGEIRAGGVEYLEVVLDEPGTLTIPVDADARAAARLLRVE